MPGRRVVWQRLPHEPARAGRRFEYDAHDGWLYVRGSDTLAAALGLHDYLKSVIRRRVCWDTVLPLTVSSLPDVDVTTGEARVDDVYYLNFCTFSYTTAYWDWDALAARDRLDGAARRDHAARRGRPRGSARAGVSGARPRRARDPRRSSADRATCRSSSWAASTGGPGRFPRAWLAEREALGSRIISRQREYGMTPVLPAFTGHVPASLAGDGTTSRTWWGFPTRLLAPDDPRFAVDRAACRRGPARDLRDRSSLRRRSVHRDASAER